MTTDQPADPSPHVLGQSLAALAAQVADLRGQIRAIDERLDQAGLHADLNLAARFENLAQTIADTLDTAAPRGPAAPYWIGLDRDTYHAQLADLLRWTDTVLRQHYSGYELRECWPRHTHAVWELSTLAAEWHHIYAGTRPDLARALEFYDRWLPARIRLSEEPPETGYVQPGLVEVQHADALRRLGDLTAARSYAERSVAAAGHSHVRGQVHRLATLATILAAQGDADAAAGIAGQMLDKAIGMESCRIADRIAAVRDADGAAARQLSERVDDVLGAPI